MSSYVSYNNNKFIEFPDIIFLGKRDVVRKDHLYWISTGELALVASVGGRLFTVLADDYYKEAGCDSNNYLNPYPSNSELNDASYTKVRAYIDEMKKSINTIRTDRATIDLSKEYLVSYDMFRRGATERRSYWAYKVTHKNSSTPSYVSVAAITAENDTVVRHCIRVISEAKPGSLLMSSGRLLKKGTYTVDKEYTPEGCNKINKGAHEFIDLWEETLSKYDSTKPAPAPIDYDKCPVVLPQAIYFSTGHRMTIEVPRVAIYRNGDDSSDAAVYLRAFHKDKSLGFVPLNKVMDAPNNIIDMHCAPATASDDTIPEAFRKAAKDYAESLNEDRKWAHVGDVDIHLSEYQMNNRKGCKRSTLTYAVIHPWIGHWRPASWIAASVFNMDHYAILYHLRMAAKAEPGSYITSDHKVLSEAEYDVKWHDYNHDLISDIVDFKWLEEWLAYEPVDTKKEEFNKAVEDFKDGKISEVPSLEYIPGTETTVSVVSQLAETTEGIYSYIAPRLDNLQEKLGTVITVLSSNGDKIEKLYNLIDENETTATNSLERVTEIQEALEDLREEFATKFNGMLLDHSSIANKLDASCEAINKLFDDMSLKFDALGQSHSTTKTMLNRLEVRTDKIKQDLVEQRSGIGGIVDVMQSTLEAMEKEFNEAKDRQISVKASVDNLTVAAHDMVQYQERILQNQERKGFWNWLKSLFKK